MAIPKGFRFSIDVNAAFPQGLVMIGEVRADTEFQSKEDRSRNRPVRQHVDEMTGKRQWKVTVTDPDETKSKRASFDVILLAEHQPVPTTSEVLPGMRPIELEGLTAEPRIAGNGEFKYQSYVFRATGFAAVGSAGGASTVGGSRTGKPADSANKAA